MGIILVAHIGLFQFFQFDAIIILEGIIIAHYADKKRFCVKPRLSCITCTYFDTLAKMLVKYLKF